MAIPFSPICRQGIFNDQTSVYQSVAYNDLRLSRRHRDLLEQMVVNQSNVVHQISRDNSEERGFYRFLNNKSVKPSEMLRNLLRPPNVDLSSRRVLVISDLTQFSLREQQGQLKDPDSVGVLSDNKTPGFYAHASLALDASHGTGLGISDLMYWTHPVSTMTKSEKKLSRLTRPWKEKESYRWWKGIIHSQEVLRESKELIYVFDSEADFADLWKAGVENSISLLIRVTQHSRWVPAVSMDLFSYLETIEFKGEYELEISALTRHNYSKNKAQDRQSRTAHMQLRYCPVDIQLLRKEPETVPLYAIEVVESAHTVPAGEEPIRWVLLSTKSIDSLEDAVEMIQWYEWRWQIEQLFRTLKRKGLRVEQTKLTTYQAIIRQTTLSFEVAFRVMRLVMARDQPEGQPIEEVFNPEEQKCLQNLNQKLLGNTQKQQNPYSSKQLAFASWVIARLGGWKGYKSQKPPGPITMKRGLEQFNTYFQAWKLFSQ